MLDEEIDRIRSVYGKRTYPEVPDHEDILSGEWKELSENGEIKENGISSTSSFSLKIVKDETIKQSLINLKKNESADVNIKKAFGNDTELIIHSILKTSHEMADVMSDMFRFTVMNIIHIEKAELGQELYNTAFGEGKVNSEAELKEFLSNDLANEYNRYATSQLDTAIQNSLISETVIDLPAEFIRKLINANKEKDQPDIDDLQLGDYLNHTKWDLIFDKIVHENNVTVSNEELEAFAIKDIVKYYGNPAMFEENPEALKKLVDSLMADEKYVKRIRDQVLNDKIFELLRGKVSVTEKGVDKHEFFHHHH
jgi:trigger factor